MADQKDVRDLPSPLGVDFDLPGSKNINFSDFLVRISHFFNFFCGPFGGSPTSPLRETENKQFQNLGYVKNLPVFDDSDIPILQKGFEEMLALLPPHIHMSRVNNWHKANRWVYELSHTKAILDYVEDLLAPI